ncbi:hypothetical protein RA19_22205 [Leisingera sp. ANG-M1]|uniref:hypothetical protein n=1 Tax=Leisingera sp. ANG-M1 TaxID=1577895 RepID=UPI00057CAC1F|nr:hypothetical protein [Leisingera sp. ANG-M1]KIC07839.1 hypothetical protein RA19_22205 [Leisingera sp. ANG-M1]
MQVIIHCGAHATEEDLLLKALLKNAGPLSRQGTAVPGPGKYRSLLKDCMAAMKNGHAAEEAPELLWDAILDDSKASRVILSNPHFFGSPRHALNGLRFYPEAEDRLQALQALFPYDQLEICMALRNPATFLPALFARSARSTVRKAMQGCDPLQLRWSGLLERMRQAVPDMAVTVWCYEDLPLIWGQILRELAGLEAGEPLEGRLDLLATLMQPAGLERLRAYLQEHPDMTGVHRRRVYAAFLDKFAREEALEEELDFPGWTDALVDEMSGLYEEDLYAVQRLPGVSLITP